MRAASVASNSILIRRKMPGVSFSTSRHGRARADNCREQPFQECPCLTEGRSLKYLIDMAKTVSLTKRELDIMSVLWRRKSATVGEIRDDLTDDLAYPTVQTMLRVL